MKKVRYIWTLVLLMVFTSGFASTDSSHEEGGDVDVNELVFGHINDAYSWHIVSIGDTHITIPLPVIVKSSTGWHVFSSEKLEEGEYEGLYIAEGGTYDGKIVERNAAGEEVRPLDISITKKCSGTYNKQCYIGMDSIGMCQMVQETSCRKRCS